MLLKNKAVEKIILVKIVAAKNELKLIYIFDYIYNFIKLNINV